MFSMAVLIMLTSLTSLWSEPVAISHPVRAVRPVKSSFEKSVSAGKVNVDSLGRLLRIKVGTASSVVDDIDSKFSASVIRNVPVID